MTKRAREDDVFPPGPDPAPFRYDELLPELQAIVRHPDFMGPLAAACLALTCKAEQQCFQRPTSWSSRAPLRAEICASGSIELWDLFGLHYRDISLSWPRWIMAHGHLALYEARLPWYRHDLWEEGLEGLIASPDRTLDDLRAFWELMPDQTNIHHFAHNAVKAGRLDFLQFLVEARAYSVTWALTATMAAAVRADNLAMLEWLYEKNGAVLNDEPLDAAIATQNVPMAKWLMAHGGTAYVDLHLVSDVLKTGNPVLVQLFFVHYDHDRAMDWVMREACQLAHGAWADDKPERLANLHAIMRWLHSAGFSPDRGAVLAKLRAGEVQGWLFGPGVDAWLAGDPDAAAFFSVVDTH